MDPVIRVQPPNTTNIGKGATSLSALIMHCARHSDGTSRKNACSQLYRCDKGTIHIAGELPHVDICTQRAVYMASHKSRHEGFTDTDAWKQLKQHLLDNREDYAKKYDEIIILFSDAIRIGVKEAHITSLESQLADISDNIHVLTLEEGGKNLKEVGVENETRSNEKSDIGKESSHMNAGKRLLRSPTSDEIQNHVDTRRIELKKEATESGKFDDATVAAIERGKGYKGAQNRNTPKVLLKLLKRIKEDDSDDNVEKCAKKWEKHVLRFERWPTNLPKESVENICMFRTSPSYDELSDFDEEGELGSGRAYIDNVSVSQAAGVRATMEIVGNECDGVNISNAAVLSERGKSRNTKTYSAIMNVMIVIPYGRTKGLWVDTSNRLSGLFEYLRLIQKTCTSKRCPVFLAKNIGQAKRENLPTDGSDPGWNVTFSDVMEADRERVKQHSEKTKKRNENIARLPVTFAGCKIFASLDEKKKLEMNERLREIALAKVPVEGLKSENDWWKPDDDEDEFSSDEEDEESVGFGSESDYDYESESSEGDEDNLVFG